MAFQPTLSDVDSAPVTTTAARVRRLGAALCLLAGAAAAASALGDVGDATSATGATDGTSSASDGTMVPAAAGSATADDAAVPIDVLTTRSGAWQLAGLPAQGDAAVYRMTLDRNPAFVREFACRPLRPRKRGAALSSTC